MAFVGGLGVVGGSRSPGLTCRPRRSRAIVWNVAVEGKPAIDRGAFPILEQEINGKPLVYFDSAATSQKPQSVIDTLLDYYKSANSNVHRGAHSLSARATDLYEGARDDIRDFVNAEHREEIIYTKNASEAINLVAVSWGSQNISKGDEIILTVMEHHSNLVPWQFLAERTGAVLKFVPLNSTGSGMDMEVFHSLLSDKTKLVSCGHISNVLGCCNPVEEIIAAAHAKGAKVVLDACQSVPHMTVDVQALDCDFLVASGHKMCGPTGIGFLYGKKDILEEMPPFMGGGEMIADVFMEYSTYAELPHKFEPGTPAIGEAIGLGAAVQYLNKIGMDKIHQYETEIGEYLYKRLSEFEEVKIYGPETQRAALCAFQIEGIHPSDLSVMLDLEGVAIRAGNHCTQPLHTALGEAGSARASLYFYNTFDEVDTFIEALKSAVDVLGGKLTKK
ncbi:hypothetical protein NDN08_003327 [Rhodosorus marinus]|uniref:cysteine desulfurase n=1 Tax=Rhodosorus marinus TaxID=101924 RepID=A0AAV8UW73_9RHOD|nr:hypothetical protein NDN08_003327 [Rhodosorus marinus]